MTTARQAGMRWLCGVLLGAALLLPVGAGAAGARIGERVVLPALSTVDGGKLGSDALRGKVVVLAWFATWCPYCMLEAPQLQKLYRENSDRLAVIGVDIEPDDPGRAGRIAKWIEKYGLTFPVTTDRAALERVLGKRKGVPLVLVIDRRGVLRQVEAGEMLDEDFDEIASFARAAD